MFVEEKSVGEEQPAKVGTLKLSEAIRVGSKIRGQCRRDYFADDRSCAIGAAYEALTGKYEPKAYCGKFLNDYIQKHFGKDPLGAVERVIKMNDGGNTREEIADWLEAQGY